MLALGAVAKTDIGMLEAEGQRYRVTLHIAHADNGLTAGSFGERLLELFAPFTCYRRG